MMMRGQAGSGSVSRDWVAASSPRTELNMECGLLLGEVPVHLLGPAVVPLSKAPDMVIIVIHMNTYDDEGTDTHSGC